MLKVKVNATIILTPVTPEELGSISTEQFVARTENALNEMQTVHTINGDVAVRFHFHEVVKE